MEFGPGSLDELVSLLGGTVIDEAPGAAASVEHMYKPRESVFGAVAREMVDAGWSVFPQEMDGNRRPGTVNGEMIKWSEKYHLATRRPDPETVDLWTAQCAPLNVAVVLGPASGNTFVIDVDVVEEELSSQIQDLADRMLGRSPLRRVGRWPKIALVYRHAPGDEVPSRSPKFVQSESRDNPDRSEQGLEIIAEGKAMTFYGKHHKTGRYFQWLEGPPHLLGPETAPLVTSSQVSDFLDAVDALRPFHRASFDATAVTWEWDEKQEINVPRIRQSSAAADWVEDDNGRVIDGREAYLTKLAFRIVTANAGVATSMDGDRRVVNGSGCDRLAQIVVEQFVATAETSGRWKGNALLREARSKVGRAAGKVASGEVTPWEKKDKDGHAIAAVKDYVPAQPKQGDPDSLDFLVPAFDPDVRLPQGIRARQPMSIEVHPKSAEAEAARALEPDRDRIGKAVTDGLAAAFSAFWDEVYDVDRRDTRVHILKAPTGAGKTSRGMQFIATDPRTKDDYTVRGSDGEIVSEGRAPIAFLVPTYANIDELRSRAKMLNLDGSVSDAELRVQAAEMGLINEDDLETSLEDYRRAAMNAGLKTMVYQGKLRAGCKMADKVKLAMQAGIGTSGFCKAEVPTGDKDDRGKAVMETKYCEYYQGCPAILQKEEIQKSHVVFMPHAFLSLNIPEELKNVRAVVADERIHHLFLHTANLDMTSLLSPRKPPRLRKKEKEAGMDASEFDEERREAIKVVVPALQAGQCPAEALAKTEAKDAEGQPAAKGWVDAAIRSCQSSVERDGSITPDMDLETLQELCARPTGKQAREELRFWKIVQERMEARITEIVNAQLAMADPALAVPRATRGARDYRIQLWSDTDEATGEQVESIRLSWRQEPNWIDRPLLLLDASAAPAMISKIWMGKDVVVHDIPAALNVRVVCVADRTYSNASVVAGPGATPSEKVSSAKLLAKVRNALSLVSAMYGWSRVVAGGSILLRKAVNSSWEGPENVDWCHYGAMRGLDFAKNHAAAISVGRMELPIRTIDGLVAALTYDDDEPEQPYDCDSRGIASGIDRQKLPLRIPVGIQKIRMRSGHDIDMTVPMFPGRWGRMIQKQYREEELLQFLGRLRPVYRVGEAPVWFSMSSVIPEEVIVDDLVQLPDFLGSDTAVWEAMRRCGGVLEPRIAAMVCDELFTSPEAAAAAMRRAGMDVVDGSTAPRVAWGVAAWRWKAAGGEKGVCFVRAGVDDAEHALRNAFSSYLDLELVRIERAGESRSRAQAKGRAADKIENELGTLSERRALEEKTGFDSAMELLMTAQPEDLEHLRTDRVGPGLPISVQVLKPEEVKGSRGGNRFSIEEAHASLAIRQLWERIHAERAASKPPVESSVPSPGPRPEAAPAVDLGYWSALLQAQGMEVDASYESAAAHVSDRARGLMEFDEQDHAIPD